VITVILATQGDLRSKVRLGQETGHNTGRWCGSGGRPAATKITAHSVTLSLLR
jgi:hypothetical protein